MTSVPPLFASKRLTVELITPVAPRCHLCLFTPPKPPTDIIKYRIYHYMTALWIIMRFYYALIAHQSNTSMFLPLMNSSIREIIQSYTKTIRMLCFLCSFVFAKWTSISLCIWSPCFPVSQNWITTKRDLPLRFLALQFYLRTHWPEKQREAVFRVGQILEYLSRSSQKAFWS